MLVGNPTPLDGLSLEQLEQEVSDALVCLQYTPLDQSERLAEWFGLNKGE